ncbi:MAG: hypothetical protein JWL95_3129 [Gemmatimonadetes bacterium]|nr:hypothetical protein [Gemmatimonadota bacterium]
MRGGRYAVRAHVVHPMPDAIASLAGDVARRLRTSLDELATALAGSPTTFPIFESLALFAQRARKPIARMLDEAQATLEELQPYHAIGGFRNGALWTLAQVDAMQPARLAAGGVLDGGAMGVNTQRAVTIVGEPAIVTGAFTDGAVIASAATRIVGPDPKLDMFLRVDHALAYAPEGAGLGQPVVALLSELCDHVEHTVFASLEPSLPSLSS